MSKKRQRIADQNFTMTHIDPINDKQEKVFEYYNEDKNLILHGSSGTGKTFVSLALALKSLMEKESDYRSVRIIRSAVQVRDEGFMPGNDEEKAAIYEGPYSEIVNSLFGRGDAYGICKKKKQIIFNTTGTLRGMTFDDEIIIVDECQSMSFHELDTIITRVGKNSRIIFCGDTKQNDLVKSKYDISGLTDFMSILDRISSFAKVEFYPEHNVRSGLSREYLLAKEAA